jgi:hypothetical protein
MSTTPDSLDSPTQPDRLFYQLGVMLDAQDFQDEQTYHRGRLARALTYLHGTGTASGLGVRIVGPTSTDVTPAPTEEEVRVEAGLAIDRAGRLIEVPRSACIRVQRWLDAQDVGVLGPLLSVKTALTVDVFLRFAACERGLTPAFATGPADALDAAVPSRVRDGYELQLAVREEDTPPIWTDPWAALRTAAGPARAQTLAGLIKGSWQAAQADDTLVPVTLDRTLNWVFLARLTVPATVNAGRVLRTADAATADDVTARPFVCSTAALLDLLAV